MVSETFIAGFIKTASKAGFFRKLVRPAALGTAGAGIGAGGFAVGKGAGKEEQLGADKKQFESFLTADYERDVANMNRVAEEAFVQGYQYRAEQSNGGVDSFADNLKKSKKK